MGFNFKWLRIFILSHFYNLFLTFTVSFRLLGYGISMINRFNLEVVLSEHIHISVDVNSALIVSITGKTHGQKLGKALALRVKLYESIISYRRFGFFIPRTISKSEKLFLAVDVI